MAQEKHAPQARYDKTHTVGVYLKLNRSTDADILAWLDQKPNRQGYIKDLIRADMENADDGKTS